MDWSTGGGDRIASDERILDIVIDASEWCVMRLSPTLTATEQVEVHFQQRPSYSEAGILDT